MRLYYMLLSRGALGVALMLALPCLGQTRPALSVVVEEPDTDDVACGIQASVLESTAVLTLRNNGVQPDSRPATNPFLHVNTLVSQIGTSGCAVSLRVSVTAGFPRRSFGGFTPRRSFTFAELCDQTRLLVGPHATMGSRVQRAVEELAKICLGELDY
jgi:hypothetical protein